MAQVSITHTFPKTPTPLVLFVHTQDCVDTAAFNKINTLYDIDVAQLCQSYKLTGKAKESFVHMVPVTNKLVPLIVVGLGDASKDTAERRLELIRRGVGVAVSQLKKITAGETIVLLPPASSVGVSDIDVYKHATIAFHLAAYELTEFKTAQDAKKAWAPSITFYSSSNVNPDAVTAGNIIGEATRFTRTVADTPPNHMTPSVLADRMKVMAKKWGLTYSVFGDEVAKKKGMGCFYFVSKGSDEEGKFVTMEYQSGKKNVPTIALVGKGVCFDTGGISLKPAQYMSGMKYDMSGAAAVAGAMQAIAQLKPDANVIAVTPLVENMPGSGAGKQDDVITAMNGKTVEVDNTDAEGRLILADALCYVQQEYKPDVILDIATLTGACMHALGHFYSGVMTRDYDLATQLQQIGELTGDKLWPLPMDDDYIPALRSNVADVRNCGTPVYKAGAMTAALFLEHFVEDTVRWAHLDIAGTDSNIPATTYLGKGATGVAVKLFIDFVFLYQNKK